MNGWFRIWSLVVLLAMGAGCATDDIPENNMDNGRTDPNGCPNPCEAGETRCNGSTIEACASDAKGCFQWSAGVDCAADGTMCDDSAEPAICLEEPGTCQDGATNQDESDIDCGGQRCRACGVGEGCTDADDCDTYNCDVGNTDECVPEDQPTCGDGELNQDETDVDCGGSCPACGEGMTCDADGDCESMDCDGGSCAAGGGPCNNGDVQCAGNTVQTCDNQQWTETEICAQGCSGGACDDAVQCQAMATRCFKNSVQQCNAQGTAWQHLDICNDECDAGLCVGACEPNALRCNGDVQEACGMDGQTWAEQQDCQRGCSHRVCVEADLENKGVPMDLSGSHVYQGCVSVELGGTINVPADETLEIWAECLEVTSSSSITLGAGARFIFHASDSITNAGTVSGGEFIRLDAYRALTNSGDVTSDRVELRGDQLTNASGGTIGGPAAYALYGTSWTNEGTHDGTVSVMPPETVSSPTHPEGFQWNMSGDDVSVAWNKPFQSAKGYYIAVNSTALPSPANGEFTTSENVTLPLQLFRPGANQVRVVSVNDDSTVGEVTADFEIDFNVTSPAVSSSSHGDSTEWSSSDDVFLEWEDASTVDPDSLVGYWYAWDHRGDTSPNENDSTFRNDKKILFNDQASGVWTFHIVGIDRFGRTSPIPSRYTVRIGPDPGSGNLAGTITDADGDPIRGASVLLNGGVYRSTSVASGDFTFGGVVPAAAFDWEVLVSAPGFESQTDTVRMSDGDQLVVDFELQKDNQPVTYELGFEVELDTTSPATSNAPDVAMGRAGEVIWSTQARAGITTTTGNRMRSFSVSPYSAERVDVGWANGQYYNTFTGYCGSYTRCVDFDFYDPQSGDYITQGASSWGNMYGPTMVWDGAKFVVVGAYSYLQFGAIDPVEYLPEAVSATGLSAASSNTKTQALHDGTSIAVTMNAYDSSAGEYQAKFGRWTRDGTEVQAPVAMSEPSRYTNQNGLAFDGNRYWVGYKGSEQKANGEYPLYLQSVDSAGSVGPLIELDGDTSYYGAPDLAFDGRNLLVVYRADNHAYLEVRDPSDGSIVQTFDLGYGINPAVDFGYHVGEGAVAYGRNTGDRRGFFMRTIRVH